MKSVLRTWLLLLIFALPALALAAKKAPYVLFHGLPIKEHRLPTRDGAELSLIEVEGNEGGPVIVIHPGLVETAHTFDDAARFYHRLGYKVVLAQVRGAGVGPYQSKMARRRRNNLSNVLRIDTPTQWDYIRENISLGRPFQVIGHSQGGGQILTMLATAEFADRYSSYVTGASLWMPAYKVTNLPRWLRRAAPEIRRLLVMMRSAGFQTIDVAHWIFALTGAGKESGNPLLEAMGRIVERSIGLPAFRISDGYLTSEKYSSVREVRRLIRQEISRLPIELLISWADAVIEGRMPVNFDLGLLRVPVQILSAEDDILVRSWHLMDLFTKAREAVPSQLVVLKEAQHVDIPISKKLNATVLPLTQEFFADAQASIARIGEYLELGEEHLPATPEECSRLLMPEPQPAPAGQ